MLKILFKLTENDKRVILAILLLVILVFVIIGFIGSIIVRVMKYQGKKLDTMCHDAVVAKVIKDEKHFKFYINSPQKGKIKSIQMAKKLASNWHKVIIGG